MSNVLDPAPLPEGLGIPTEDWHQTPVSVRLAVLTLLKRLETLEARLHQNSSNSSRPLSTDAPAKKRQRRMNATERRRPGGKLCKATIPADQRSGYGPRLTGFIGEMAGIVGASRSAVQDLCTSVFGIPLSKGAIQKMVDRVSEAILPHYTAIGEVARASRVNYLDETSWLTGGDRGWLWVMANPHVADFQIHPNRSKGAFTQLIADWMGILVSDGYLVYQYWQGLRQSCLAHLIRTAKGLTERMEAGIARFGVRIHAELQRLCHMGTERPTVGQWRAW